MFVGKRPDGSVYGAWTCRQPEDEFHPNITELPDDHADVLEFTKRERAVYIDPRDAQIAQLEARLSIVESDVAVKVQL